MKDMKKKTTGMAKLAFLLLAAVLAGGMLSCQSAAAKSKSPKVTVKVGEKTVTKKTYSMEKGSKATLKVSTSGLKGKKKIKYSSASKKVASVTSKGVVTGKKTGTAKIKITASAGKKKASSWVKIKVVKKSSATPTPPDSDTTQSKILVAYFSCTGTTKKLAEYAAEYLNADIYEIVPEEPYTKEDLAYYTGGRADREQDDPDVRPVISGKVENMAQYDTVVLGYPIWHGQAPRIISTFLESYDFDGKTILPFCTSGSSGIGSSADDLHKLVSDSTKWLDGKRFASGTSRGKIETWLDENGITQRN